MKRFVMAALGAVFFASPVFAADPPACQREATDANLCQQQLTNLHTLYDRQERASVAGHDDLRNAQDDLAKWQSYYTACSKGGTWDCGPWPAPGTPPAAPAAPTPAAPVPLPAPAK